VSGASRELKEEVGRKWQGLLDQKFGRK
jgi:hypothetical protein